MILLNNSDENRIVNIMSLRKAYFPEPELISLFSNPGSGNLSSNADLSELHSPNLQFLLECRNNSYLSLSNLHTIGFVKAVKL